MATLLRRPLVLYTIGKLLLGMPNEQGLKTQPNIQMIKLDRKSALFFIIEKMVLFNIYPYKKDITKSKYY